VVSLILLSIIPPSRWCRLSTYTTLFRSVRSTGDRLSSTGMRSRGFRGDAETTEWTARVLQNLYGVLHFFKHAGCPFGGLRISAKDRKSTRLNSSHVRNSYAVFCLQKEE